MGTIKASNKSVNSRMLDIQLLKDGKATKEWSYSNSADMLIQMASMAKGGNSGPAGMQGMGGAGMGADLGGLMGLGLGGQ